MFQLLKNEGAFSGAGAYLYLDECPDIKFGQKNFKEVLNSSPEFQRAFAKLIFVTLSKFLSDTRAVQESNENSASENIMNMISEMSMSNLD
jgi:hypothetical protein